MQEGIFDLVAEFIQVFIVRSLNISVFPGRDNGFHSLISGLIYDGVAIIALIGDQVIGAHALNQAASLRAIRSGTLRDNDSERHTMRIHGQMYLGVEPPFVRLIS